MRAFGENLVRPGKFQGFTKNTWPNLAIVENHLATDDGVVGPSSEFAASVRAPSRAAKHFIVTNWPRRFDIYQRQVCIETLSQLPLVFNAVYPRRARTHPLLYLGQSALSGLHCCQH